jgi:uncharacterized protein YrrD
MRQSLLIATAALALLASPALAQEAKPGKPAGSNPSGAATPASPRSDSAARTESLDGRSVPVIVMALIPAEAATIKPVSAEELYTGFRANDLIGQNVYGTNGNEIGEVQDLIVGADGRLKAAVIEGGGFLDIGDATFRVPFDQLDLTAGREGIVAKNLTEDKAASYGLYDLPEAVATGPREYRVSELKGDYARLRFGQAFGVVRDMVFDRQGKVTAVLVNRDVRYGAGVFAYPYYGYNYGFDPGANYVALPFDSLQLASKGGPRVDLDEFDSEAL